MAEKLHGVSSNGYPHIEPVKVSGEELLEEIRQGAKSDLGMTLEEFIDAYKGGTLPDDLIANELAMLLYFVEHSSGIPAGR